jgi:small-conductance mechanosensitive channel
MTTWVDSKTPTRWKWAAVVIGFLVGIALACSPIYVGYAKLHGWPMWVVALGVVITLLATFILQMHVALVVLALASFAFCANVSSGHMLAWALAWIATVIGALVAHGFLVDMSWLYHWSKVGGESAANDQENTEGRKPCKTTTNRASVVTRRHNR